MATVNANEVVLGIESFGDDDAPLVLLAGATTLLSWPDALCERLADGGRRQGAQGRARHAHDRQGHVTGARPCRARLGLPASSPNRASRPHTVVCDTSHPGTCRPLLS
jgi:hypothetical protein